MVGHRTLFLAMKVLSDDDWNKFSNALDEIANDPDRDDKRWVLISDME